MNDPISLNQIVTAGSGNTPEKRVHKKTLWPWLSSLLANPLFKKILLITQTLIKATPNVLLILLMILPFIKRGFFDVRFSFTPEDDFGMSFLEMMIDFIWFILLLILCLVKTLQTSFKNGLMVFAICIASHFMASYIFNRLLNPGDYLRLNRDYAMYKATVMKNPNIRHRFKWGHYGFVTLSGDRTLVYDPSDTLPAKNKLKNKEFLKRKSGRGIKTEYLYDHFYVEDSLH